MCDVSSYVDDGKKSGKTWLYNAMINPITYFAIKGVNWYQGMQKSCPPQATYITINR